MNKNYYQILQIDRNASPEIIEKAYKTLAKKYHPDLQEETNKKYSEEILKQINEAYEILSNPEKKLSYDQTLENNIISQKEYEEILRQNQILKSELQNRQNMSNTIEPENNNVSQEHYYTNSEPDSQNYSQHYQNQLQYQEDIQKARQKAYYDAYIQDLKNRGYKIHYKKTLKEYFKDLTALFITFFILFILWHIPFIKNFFINLYNQTPILKGIVESLF